VLLLNAGEAVSTDRLIDALWGEHPPETAGKALQVYVSQLRKTLGSRMLVTRPPGYALEIPGDALDVHVFDRLCSEGHDALAAGDAATAGERLREALALWYGTPLADLRYEAFAQPHAARLEEQRLGGLEDRIDADLALGRHGALAGELDELVGEHPLRERLRCQLMLALYRSGRQADALAAFSAARRTLVDELGIEPGRELRELHGAVLRQDEGLDAPRVPAAEEPAPKAARTGARDLRKTVTALHVALAAGAGIDPEAAHRVTSRAVDTVSAAVGRHGGLVEAVAGDGVTAVFGLPAVHEDDALRAARAAFEIRGALAAQAFDTHLVFRVGVSTGEVLAGSRPHPVGEPLTAAPVLARLGSDGGVVVDEKTRRLLEGLITAADVADGAFELVALDAASERAPRSAMVGRGRELRRLRDAFEQALADRSCQLFTILGPAGVGKSRLVHELLGGLPDETLVARGRCLPYGDGITFWPVLEAVKEAAGIGEGDSADGARSKLTTLLEGDPDAVLVAQRVAELTGLTETIGGVDEGADAVRRLVQALARNRPVVLLFDDIHWGAATFLDLLEHLADRTRDGSLLLLCVARPELLEIRAGWAGGKPNATSVLLEPLSADESSELVDNLAGPALDVDARARVIEAADGNPLFVEELVALGLDEDNENRLTVPPTIQALLAARLDRLADDERAVLERASVEGKAFHGGYLTAGDDDGGAIAILEALVRKDIIRPDRPLFTGERGYRFRHLLIRDAAYASVPKAGRAVLHERYAGWLEEKAGERMPEYEEIAGYHLEQAVGYGREVGLAERPVLARHAAARLGAAGRRAFGRSDSPAAVNLISRAAALLPGDDPARIELIPNVRVAQGLGANLDWADAILADAVVAGDERLRAHALVQRGFLRLFTAPDTEPAELLAVANEAALVFERLDDALGLARAWRLIAQARYLGRSGAGCVDASERALVEARRAADEFETKEIVEWLAVALGLGSTPAQQAAERCAELREEFAGEPFLQVTLLAIQAQVEAEQGRPEYAHELLGMARRTAGDERELRRIAYYSIYAAMVLDDPASAERELRAGLEALGQVAEQTNSCTLAAQLARTLCDQERYEEAEDWTRVSERAARANDVMANILWRAARGRALAGRGDVGSGLALAREAVALGATSDFLTIHGEALMDEARILRVGGDDYDARRDVEQAIELYERKGNVTSAARARALLDAP